MRLFSYGREAAQRGVGGECIGGVRASSMESIGINSAYKPSCGTQSADAIDAVGAGVLRLPERHVRWVQTVNTQLRGVVWQVDHGARGMLDSIQH